MKKIYLSLLTAFLFFIACNNNKAKDNTTPKDTVTIDTSKVQGGLPEIQQIKDRLGSLTPLSADELKALMPEQLMGATRSDLDASAAMGALVANANYTINDSAKLKLEVVDCAGPGGVGLFTMQYVDVFDDVEVSDDETTFKVIEFNGQKAFESCMKNRPGDCTFTYFSGGRFLIAISGDKLGLDALKNVANTLKFK